MLAWPDETATVRIVPIAGNPEVTATLSCCRLCLAPIAMAGPTGAWTRLTWGGDTITGGVLCPTTTGEVTGHLPEPPLTVTTTRA